MNSDQNKILEKCSRNERSEWKENVLYESF